jgi:hypothetical protein
MDALILYAQRLPYPYQDDFNAILAFALEYDHAAGFLAKALVIERVQHNSYRLIFEHLVIAFELGLTHHLNFAFLTAFGDLFLLGILVLLWFSFEEKPRSTKLLYFLPVSLTFLSLSYWENLNWAMTGLQNTPVVFFALLALLLLGPLGPPNTARLHNGKFFFSCVGALLCCCCSPNGFLLAPVGMLVLLSRRSYKRTILWLFSFILPFAAYLDHPVMQPGQHRPLLTKLFYFIAFLGGAFGFRPVAFLAGAVLLAVFLWAARTHVARERQVLFPFAIWIVLTSALVEAIRAAITSRYSIYSVLLLVCCYSFLLRKFDQEPLTRTLGGLVNLTRTRFLTLAIASSLCIYVPTAVWAYRHLHKRREMVLSGYRYYRANPLTNSPQANPAIDVLYPTEKPFELLMLHQAQRDGLYTVPPGRETFAIIPDHLSARP